MKAIRGLCSLGLLVLSSPLLQAQAPPVPGPEFDVLKKMVGDWDLTMKAAGMEFKGSVTYKMELGGLWLGSSLECDLFGAKFSGKGLDTYDAAKKKYISVIYFVYLESMSASDIRKVYMLINSN